MCSLRAAMSRRVGTDGTEERINTEEQSNRGRAEVQRDRRLASPAVSRTKKPLQNTNPIIHVVCVFSGFSVREARFAGRSRVPLPAFVAPLLRVKSVNSVASVA